MSICQGAQLRLRPRPMNDARAEHLQRCAACGALRNGKPRRLCPIRPHAVPGDPSHRYLIVPPAILLPGRPGGTMVEQESTRFYMLWPPLAVRATSPVYLAAVLSRPSQHVSLSIAHQVPSVATRPHTRSIADPLRPRNPCHAEPPLRPCRAPVLRLSRRIKLSRWKGELHYAPDAAEGTRSNSTGSVGARAGRPIPRREL
jgi:hypothetical protein